LNTRHFKKLPSSFELEVSIVWGSGRIMYDNVHDDAKQKISPRTFPAISRVLQFMD
jgi:hypothetical protein